MTVANDRGRGAACRSQINRIENGAKKDRVETKMSAATPRLLPFISFREMDRCYASHLSKFCFGRAANSVAFDCAIILIARPAECSGVAGINCQERF
jgi:hypothetical protein